MKKIFFVLLCGIALSLLAVYLLTDKSQINQSADGRDQEPTNVASIEVEEPIDESLDSSTFVELEPIDPDRMEIADVSVPVLYETDIDPDLKQDIARDIALVYAHMESHDYYDLRDGPTFSIAGRDQQAVKVLNFKGETQHRPTQFKNRFGRIIRNRGSETAVVPASLINEYQLAVERRNRHAKKYSALKAFVAKVNNATATTPLSLSPSDLIWTKESSVFNPESAPSIIQSFSEITLREPSLLEFEENQAAGNDEPELMGKAYIFREGTNIPDVPQYLVYHQNKWKFFYGRPGT